MEPDQLKSLRDRVAKKLPGINVELHPYDVGYWGCAAHIRRPKTTDEDFNAGWEQRRSERGIRPEQMQIPDEKPKPSWCDFWPCG